MTGLGIVPLALLAAVLLMGCGSSRRGEPFVGPLALESHPGGEAGVGPAFTNKPLPMFLVRAQVRYGLGAMPTSRARTWLMKTSMIFSIISPR